MVEFMPAAENWITQPLLPLHPRFSGKFHLPDYFCPHANAPTSRPLRFKSLILLLSYLPDLLETMFSQLAIVVLPSFGCPDSSPFGLSQLDQLCAANVPRESLSDRPLINSSLHDFCVTQQLN